LTPSSYHSPPGDPTGPSHPPRAGRPAPSESNPREAVRRWLAHKGLDLDLAIAAGVKYEPGGKLWFAYQQPDGEIAWRIFHANQAIVGETNYRLWQKGAHAKGALWFPVNEHCTEPDTVLVCEGETDALAAIQSHCPWAVVSVPGSSMSDTTLRTFAKQRRWDRIVVAFDNDEAGHKGARDVVSNAKPHHCCRLTPPKGDLKEWLQGDQPRVSEADWDKISLALEDFAPVAVPRPQPSGIRLPDFSRPMLGDEKPDLLQVWRSIARPLPRRPSRRDAKGRVLQEAFCPFHDDGSTPGAWVGETRWGCWVCGIESADVYELLGWHHNLVPLGQKLSGTAFTQAKDLGRAYTGGLS